MLEYRTEDTTVDTNWEIVGNFCVKYMNSGDLKIILIPSSMYMTPDKKYAILSRTATGDSMPQLRPLRENKTLELKIRTKVFHKIISFAGEKQIKLYCIERTNLKLKVIGFEYPYIFQNK